MGMNDWVYRLKYKDADGTATDREIEIKGLRLGDKPSNTYIRAFCHSANDMRTFRLDRVRALYLGNEKIKDLMACLAERFGEEEPEPADTEALAAEAALDSEAPQPVPPPAKKELKFEDIPKAKKGIRLLIKLTIVLVLLGFISLPTIILPILFFGGALILIFSANNVKKQIKKLEAEAAAEVKQKVNSF
jgi:hypothetical protein